MAMDLEISSLAGLEEAILELSSGEERPSVRVRIDRVGDLFEVGPLLRHLQKQFADSGHLWMLNDASLAALLQASEYYQKLDLLELHLDLMRMDIEENIAIKKIRFDGVRQTANEVVANAHPTSTFEVLESITIEGQRIARVANLLGLGGADVEVAKLTDDDLEWFLEGVLGAEENEIHLEEDLLEDKEAGLRFGSGQGTSRSFSQVSNLGFGEGKILEELTDKCSTLHLGASEGLGGVCGREAGVHHLCHGNGKFNPEAKEITKGVLLQKISRLHDILQRTKRSPFVV